MHLESVCFYINMNEFNDKHSFLSIKYIAYVSIVLLHMFELFSCFEYQFYKKGKFSIKLCEKVILLMISSCMK